MSVAAKALRTYHQLISYWMALMALSDSCLEFLHAVSEAALVLARDVPHYAGTENPTSYGDEIDALRRACRAVSEAPYDPEAGARLLASRGTVVRFHDTPPDTPEVRARQSEMRRLILLLQKELNADEAEGVQAAVENIASESPYTEPAAEQCKLLLPKLGKSAYEIAMKIITDVGSVTAKKILGL